MSKLGMVLMKRGYTFRAEGVYIACGGGGTHEEGVYFSCGGSIHCVRRGCTLIACEGGIHCVWRGWYSRRGVYIACGGGGTHEEGLYIAYGGSATHEEGVYIACGGGATHEEGVYIAYGGVLLTKRGYTSCMEGVVLTKRGLGLVSHEEGLHFCMPCVWRGCGVLVRRWVYIACGGGGTRAKRGYTLRVEGVYRCHRKFCR